MTVHGAKGLEFEHVLLTGMEEEMFPYKGVDPGEREELEEERRLAYVAITRARKHLVDDAHADAPDLRDDAVEPTEPLPVELPRDVAEHQATPAMGGERFGALCRSRRAPMSASAEPWRQRAGQRGRAEPRAARGGMATPAGRRTRPSLPRTRPAGTWITPSSTTSPTTSRDMPLRRGARVRHDRFGEGEVMGSTSIGEPAVVAFFPGWGEKKILARFLKPAG